MQRREKKEDTAGWEKSASLASSAVAPVDSSAENGSAIYHYHPPVWYLDLLSYDSSFNVVRWPSQMYSFPRSETPLGLYCTAFRRVQIYKNQ